VLPCYAESTLYLAIPVAVFFLAMGLVALAQPARVLALFGVEVGTPEGRTEVRAVYGGFGVAIAGLLAVALFVDEIREGTFWAVGVALFGMAAGRLLSFFMRERSPLWPTWTIFGAEVVMGAMLVVAATV